jgi:outer membrane receptor for ferrienterochelin and colicins
MIRKAPFLLLLFFCIHTIAAQEKEHNISGIVLDSLSGEPLMGVYITTGKQGAQTNNKGVFILENIPEGNIRLSTMYYSIYPKVSKEFYLKQDTFLTFVLREQIHKLNEVVVLGTMTEKKLSEVPVLTTLIQEKEIMEAGAVSTLESLQDNIPGIVISPNAMGNNMRIRGLNSRYILFLVDGERLVSEGAGGNVNLDQIDVSNIQRIEMINGAASALYGSNAVGAVINIITKEPVHRIEAGANIIAESNNTWQTKVSIGSNLKKLSTRVSAFRNSSDGFDIDGGAYAARYEDWGSNIKLEYKPVERIDLNLTGRYFRHETFNPENSMNVSHPLTHSTAIGGSGGYLSADKRNKLRLSINWDKYLDYNVLERKNNETNKQNAIDYLSTRLVNTFTANPKWEFVGGLEYNYEKNYAIKTLGPEPVTRTLDDANAFAQADYKPVKNLEIIGGARYTYNARYKSVFTPKLSAMYSLGNFNFRGGIGTAFRAPSIKELYYDFDHQGMFWVYGNPDLEAEKGLYTSLSAEYINGIFNASLSGYYNNIDNKITQYDVITPSGSKEKYYKNVSSATLKGFDLNISYILWREIVLKGSYSFCDAQDNSTGLQLYSNVKHSATTSVTWNGKILRSPFSLQLAGKMNSPILYQEVLTGDDGSETVETSRSKSYSIWKVVLVKPFRLKKHTLELTLKCDNLFNFKETSFINPGRQYLVGLRYAFK